MKRAASVIAPGAAWMVVFLVLPVVGLLALSVLSRGPMGEVEVRMSSENITRLFSRDAETGTWIYFQICLQTLLSALSTTVVSAAVGLPLVFWVVSLRPPWRTVVLAALLTPFWTNLLVRTYGWQLLLAPTSPISKIAAYISPEAEVDGLYPGVAATLVALIADYLPFFLLPLYASVEKIDWRIWDAARDLGATGVRAFTTGVLPQIRPGLSVGVAFVFVPSLGQYLVPDLMGGGKTLLLGNVIAQQFGASRDWPFGASLALLQFALAITAVLLLRRGSHR
jgi:spermidine/putrescine transport system permease protein